MISKSKNNHKELSLVHLNVRSIRSLPKFEEVVRRLCPLYDVVILTETWLRKEESAFYNINGYERASCCREARGGGILIFIKKGLSINGVSISPIESAESISVELSGGRGSVSITAIYRRPSNPPLNFITELDDFLEKNRRQVILGDLNIHYNNGQDPHQMGPLLASHGYASLINSPTRLNPPRTLDHILTNLRVSSSGTIDLGVSDHLGVWCKIPLRLDNSQGVLPHRTNFLVLRSRLASESWEGCYMAADVDQKYEAFFSVLKGHVAQATEQRSPFDSRTPEDLRLLKAKRDKLWRLLFNATKRGSNPLKTERLRQEYKKARNRYQNRKAKIHRRAAREEVRVQQPDGANIWKVIRRLRRSDVVPPISELRSGSSGDLLSDPTEISNELNRYFVTGGAARVVKPMDTLAISRYMGDPADTCLEFSAVTRLEVLSLLNSLGRPSAGYDGLRSQIVFHVRDLISEPLTHIINAIITSCTYPKALKVARVVPIYKAGDRSNPGNYRPISVLPVLNKVVEKALVKQMQKYLEANNLLSNAQFGFRRKHGTGHALLELLESTRFQLDRGMYCAAILVDLRRAFDSVRHDVLLHKLSHLGFSSASCALLSSYLCDRTQFVDLRGHQSQCLPVTLGVPQGSCIGPLAFLCYINDLERSVSAKAILYADDTTLQYVGPSLQAVQEVMQRDLHSLGDWCHANHLTVNDKKTQLIVFSSGRHRPPEPVVHLNNCSVSVVDRVKLLGAVIDSGLVADVHVEELVKRLSSVVYFTRYLKNALGPGSCNLLYSSYFLPHVCYGAEFWTACSKKWLDRLNVVQGRFLRMFRGSASRERTELGILNAYYLSRYLLLCIVFRNINEIGPRVLTLDFLGVHRDTRATKATLLKIRAHKSSHCGRAFGTRAASEWNRLPHSLRSITSMSRFKVELKAYLLKMQER